MLALESLRELVNQPDYSRKEKLLICMAVDAASPKRAGAIRALTVDAGCTEAKKWNVSDILKNAKGVAIRTREGWELTSQGRHLVTELAGAYTGTVAPRVASGLRHHITTIADPQTKEFLDEALRCFEAGLYRAAVVLSWVGAVALLQDHVVRTRLADFNAEATRRDRKWKAAKTRDDSSRLKEVEFLHILDAISVIGKSVKHELEVCLKLRNGCGHPNSLKIGEAKAASHLETLIQNVFAVF